MERVVRLYQLWNWLPHFRAVAETEHLPTASEALGLSPSALSRALKQLEGDVGRDLFVRDGRTIKLNSYGNELLTALRLGMRAIDDALTSLAEETTPIQISIAAPGPFHSSILLDLVRDLNTRFQRVGIELCSRSNNEVIASLCRGSIDLAIHQGAMLHSDLVSIELAPMMKVPVVATSHPLASRTEVSLEEVAGFDFVAPPAQEDGTRDDGWPASQKRSVRLSVAHMQTGVDACKSGNYVAVLPERIARANELHVLSISDWQPLLTPLYLTRRQPTPLQPPEIQVLVEGIVASLGQPLP